MTLKVGLNILIGERRQPTKTAKSVSVSVYMCLNIIYMSLNVFDYVRSHLQQMREQRRVVKVGAMKV